MKACVIRIGGQVQGVGFRPFVWRTAQAHGITGTVSNDAEGVIIEAEGGALDAFLAALQAEHPALAKIDRFEMTARDALGASDFRIVASSGGVARTRITPDQATCPVCLEEIRSPGRREGYPFTNCTDCGPRFSIVEGVPYDRGATTMCAFEMCAACRVEYEDPADRRFHAQPIACPECGPHLSTDIEAMDRVLVDGGIVALKGLGGFHLVVDACDEDAVARLRERKRRPDKPLALMAPDLGMVERYAHLNDDLRGLLQDPAAPIVLLQIKEGAVPALAEGIAPGLDLVGFMLPMTPLHHLLAGKLDRPLVMTSGNPSGRPQCIDNDDAQASLADIADLVVTHDRGIARRLDDSVTQWAGGTLRMHRRARGYAPEPIPLPPGFEDAPQVLAVGGHLKSTFCLTRDGSALVSHHLGDLDTLEVTTAYRQALADYREIFASRPAVIARDSHPDYRSTRIAEEIAATEGLPVVAVPHHHAHFASVLAENGYPRDGAPVAGIVLDGLGMGGDGHLRGGETLLGDYGGMRTVAALKAVAMPGGEQANLEPWRNLLAQLDAAGLEAQADEMLGGRPLDPLRQAIARGLNAPLCSSAGRLFDAVAAFLGLAPERQTFEGQVAMRLEAAARAGGGEPYSFERVAGGNPGGEDVLDPAPMWRALIADRARGEGVADMAYRFHAGLAQAMANAAVEAGVARVALSGGCFHNALLLERTLEALEGQDVLTHRALPAGDGGLSLGQAVIAIARASAQ